MPPPLTIGKICLKSPENNTELPPKGLSHFSKSLRDRSTALIAKQCCIEISSQTIKSRLINCSAFLSLGSQVQVKSEVTSNGMPNVEWAVIPLIRSRAAIPDAHTATLFRPNVKHSFKMQFKR
ncbi:hypothetical protein O181_001152 [Austropuccinia psidii MF-1]|uniref:Uncharacterized protein n=1 Tax=Austropuccinia psidii MF-1 TaxID=1389203 RepID=A0A9Q3BA16_9BASI|nr:hypothetical protein [Austropuccinia psidii MF-1]